MKHSKFIAVIALIVAMMLCMSSAMACTTIYVGDDLTADGSTMFGRSEDISNSYNKVMYVSPAGQYKAGEEYVGCYGFVYTWEKDSYSFTTFADDNMLGICPDCGGEHAHNPYGAAGTNEMGVSITATETIHCSDALYEADPYVDTGIEEAEIVTVVLSQAATAKEAVELLLGIYDTYGCCGGSGLIIADNNETWYIENTTGTQYIALKLTESMVLAQPNMSIIGLIDLDDTENVIASAGIIETAKNANSYVGDEAANTIDYVASYNADQSANGRMVDALKYFNAATAVEEPAADAYTISNVDAEGNIVPMYTNITLDKVYEIADVIGYYDIPSIGYNRNLETHIFQTYADDSLTDTMMWVAMDDAALSPFVPFYPMLTTDTYAGYKLGTEEASFTEEEPTDADVCYATTKNIWTDEGRVAVDGYVALPANWAESYYWTFDALSNLYEAGNLTDDQKATIDAGIADMQAQCYDAAAALATAADAAAATQISNDCAAAMHAAAIELVNAVK